MKILKTILIISTAIFGAEFLVAPVAFANDNLVVQFEQTPLFSEANFLPGEGITRWVKVTNNSGQTQRIATQPLNITDPNHLGAVLNLVIKEGGTTFYNNAISNFLAGGENYLSSLANGANTQYDFTVSFYSGAQNTFQGKSLGFDILIGFQGTEGGILPGAGSSGGGGGGEWLPPGLTISNQSDPVATDANVLITWNTSYPATSQVIYGKEGEKHTLDLTDNIGTPPKYGYERTSPESDISPKATSHSVTISGLTPGTKYYYRAVSHASPPTISREYSFTTLALSEALSNKNEGDKKAEARAGESEKASGYLPPSDDGNAEETSGEISFKALPVPKTGVGSGSAGNSAYLINSGNVLGASSNPILDEKNAEDNNLSAETENNQNERGDVTKKDFPDYNFAWLALVLILIIIGLALYIIKLKKNQKKNV